MESTNRGASVEEEFVTVLFADICDFDGLVAKMSPKEFINLLDRIYSTFDQLCSIHGLQKIETVGKTYMAAGGIRDIEKDLDPVILSKSHTLRTFELSLDIIDLISKMRLDNGDSIKIKIGIHTKEVNAAVVGNHKPQFSLIGDTVNTAARMSGNSTYNSILVTEEAYAEISKHYKDFFELKKVVAKGKGEMNCYLCTPNKPKKESDKRPGMSFLNKAFHKKDDEDRLDRKNSIKSNNSNFIIDRFMDEKEKDKRELEPIITNFKLKQLDTERKMTNNSSSQNFKISNNSNLASIKEINLKDHENNDDNDKQ